MSQQPDDAPDPSMGGRLRVVQSEGEIHILIGPARAASDRLPAILVLAVFAAFWIMAVSTLGEVMAGPRLALSVLAFVCAWFVGVLLIGAIARLNTVLTMFGVALFS